MNAKEKLFAKGKRGVIYKKGRTIIKIKNPDSKAAGRIKNEAGYLKLLNKYNIGPKFISYKSNKLEYIFVEGELIIDFIEKAGRKEIIRILKNVLKQCFIMDRLKINKMEMHHPVKHIIVNRKHKKPVLIDFERCYKTDKPKNVTQFLQFINCNLKPILIKKRIKINRMKLIESAKRYKRSVNKGINKKEFCRILQLIK